MNIWATISLISAIISLFLIFFIFNLDIKSKLNKIFFFILIICFIWSLSEFNYRHTNNLNRAIIWAGIAKIWIFILPLTIHFLFLFVEKKNILKSKLFYFIIYFPAIILYILDLLNLPFGPLRKQYWGYSNIEPNNYIIYIIYLGWASLMAIVSGIISLYYLIKIKNFKNLLVLIGIFTPIVTGLLTELVFPIILKKLIPELTCSSFIIFEFIIVYVIYKYHLFIPDIKKSIETILSTMSEALFILSIDFKIKKTNKACFDLFGYNEEELIDKNINLLIHPSDEVLFEKTLIYSINNNYIVKDEETQFKTKNNEVIPVSYSCSLIRDKNYKILGILLIVRDIKKRKYLEEMLNNSNENFVNIIDKSIEGIIVLDKFYNIKYINPIANIYMGYEDNITEKNFFYDIKLNSTMEIEINLSKNVKGYGEVITVETKWNKEDAYLLMIRDITIRKNYEKELINTIRQKDGLLSEIHHRVKNNLQIVMSLLKIPTRYNSNIELKNILLETQNRIKSMALIHEMLYNKNNFIEINFKEYIIELTKILLSSYNVKKNIKLSIDFEDVINLDIENSISCGLIINELFSNSLKYAFPEENNNKENIISIIMKKNNNKINLIYKDNGVGLPDNIDFNKINTLGLYLIRLLAIDRLQGSLEVNNRDGLEYIIKFIPDRK